MRRRKTGRGTGASAPARRQDGDGRRGAQKGQRAFQVRHVRSKFFLYPCTSIETSSKLSIRNFGGHITRLPRFQTLPAYAAMNIDMMTISRYITETQRKSGGSGEFTQLMNGLVAAIKAISSAVRVAGLNNLQGLAGTGNATGDDQVRCGSCLEMLAPTRRALKYDPLLVLI